jgi:hypothetical protein
MALLASVSLELMPQAIWPGREQCTELDGGALLNEV